jgi:hypothetical protein
MSRKSETTPGLVADEPNPLKQEVDKLDGIWMNEALSKMNDGDTTRLHVTLGSPKFDKEGASSSPCPSRCGTEFGMPVVGARSC